MAEVINVAQAPVEEYAPAEYSLTAAVTEDFAAPDVAPIDVFTMKEVAEQGAPSKAAVYSDDKPVSTTDTVGDTSAAEFPAGESFVPQSPEVEASEADATVTEVHVAEAPVAENYPTEDPAAESRAAASDIPANVERALVENEIGAHTPDRTEEQPGICQDPVVAAVSAGGAAPATLLKKTVEVTTSATGDAPSASVTKKSDGWHVDTTYIDSRTLDPNRLSKRATGDIAETQVVLEKTTGLAPSSTVTKADGQWKVSTEYIDVRTKDPNRLQARRSSMDGNGLNSESICASSAGLATVTATSTVSQSADGKWSVDTSYVDHRTKDPNLLPSRRGKAVSDDFNTPSTKDEDGKWRQVATPHINNRTYDVERLDGRRNSVSAGGRPDSVTSTASQGVDGKWKVDTTYTKLRTALPDNIRAVDDKAEESSYSNPSATKYTYEQLKLPLDERPTDINPAVKEQYLSEDEFSVVFKMTSAEFAKVPKWKQAGLKKQLSLF